MKKLLLLIIFVSFGMLTFLPAANAQINSGLLKQMTGKTQLLNNALGVSRDVTDSSGVDKYIGNVIGIILSFAGVIFLVLMIIAGYMWITAQGSDEKITKAKQLLTNGIIGVAISFGAFIIINAVITPLSKKFFVPAEQITAGTGEELPLIACNNSAQCADQTYRRLCINGNCLECDKNDLANSESSQCTSYSGTRPTCDLVNSVCVPNLNTKCTNLKTNACSIRNDCRVDYKISFETINICAEKGVIYPGSIKGNSCSEYNEVASCGQHEECEWRTNVKEYYTDSFCLNKSDYKCPAQCQGDKKFCISSVSPAKCVECRDDNDCAGNWLDKKCSISTGNYICVPF